MHLETTLPAPVCRVVLPRCRAAVKLQAVEDGFIADRRTPEGIRLQTDDGGDQLYSADSATTRLLRQVRNAGTD